MKAHSARQRSVSQDPVTSRKITHATNEQTGNPDTGPLSAVHAEASGLSPPVPPQNACHKAASPKSATKHTRTGHVCDSKGSKRGGKSSGDLQSDTLTHRTKFFVLQFLHESMNEESLLYLSQSSFSNTSESESRCLSHADKLRQQWQFNRSSQSSSPIFQSAHSKPKQKPKPKCSKAFQTHLDESHRKDVHPQTKPSRAKKRVPSTTDKDKPARLLRQNAIQDCHQNNLLRSISENTESSDCGTYASDADDELDGSHNSSQQGSVTSRSFRDKLSQYYKQCNAKRQKQQHAVKSQRERVQCDSPNCTSNRSAPCDLDIDSASSILSLDMINLEQQPVSPTTQFARVNDYLVQISQTSVESNHHENSPSVELTDLDLQYLDAAAKELNLSQHDAFQTCSDLDKQFDEEEQSISISIESDLEGNDDQEDDEDQVNDTEAACGGENPDEDNEKSGGRRHSIPTDCSKLRLDVGDPEDATLLIDAVHALQQDIEEEMSSLESEIDEVLQTLHSDHFHSCTLNLSRSRSLSPEAAEVVRMLARIGDEVQQRHFQDLDRAVSQLLIGSCAGFFTYENFCKAAPQALDGEVDKWKQVATLLLYSQHVALHLSRFGRQGLNRVVDYTARMLVDTAADFIIGQGGWSPMLEPSSATPSSPDHPGPVLNPFLGPFTTPTTTSTNSQPPDLPGDDSATSSTTRPPKESQVVAEAVPKSVCLDANKGSTESSQTFTQGNSESLHLREDVHGDRTTGGITIITDSVASSEDSKFQENSSGVDSTSLLHVTSPGCQAISPSSSSGGHNPQEGARLFTFNSEAPGYTSPQDVPTCPVPHQITEELNTLPLYSVSSTITTEDAEEEEEETGESRQRKQKQHERTEILGNGGIVSDVCRTALNSSLSTKYTMLSLGLLALSAAAAFKFARRF